MRKINRKRKPFFILFLNRHEKAAMMVPNSIEGAARGARPSGRVPTVARPHQLRLSIVIVIAIAIPILLPPSPPMRTSYFVLYIRRAPLRHKDYGNEIGNVPPQAVVGLVQGEDRATHVPREHVSASPDCPASSP